MTLRQSLVSGLILAVSIPLILTGADDAAVLHDATPVRLRINRTLSSGDATVGDRIDFEVLDEVKIGNTVVIARGSSAIGTVTRAEKKRRMGRGGKLDLTIDFVRAVNGDKVALRAVKETSGGGHVGAMTGGMVAAGILFFPAAPFFLFMQGKDITIPQGTEVTAYSNGEITLNMAAMAPKATAPAAPVAATAAARGPGLTNADVLKLKEAGLGDDLIVSKIKASGADYKVDVADLVELKKANISDAVIAAMIDASKQGGPAAAPVAAAPATPVAVPAVGPVLGEWTGEQQWPGLHFTISFNKGAKEITNLKLTAACLEGGTKFDQVWFSPFPIAADGSFTSVGVPGNRADQTLKGSFLGDQSAEGVFETGMALGCTKDAASNFKVSGSWQARPKTPASAAPAAVSTTSAESVHPLRVELGKPIAIGASGLEITLTKIQVAGGALQADGAFNVAKGRIDLVSGGMPPRRSVRPTRQKSAPENAGVLSVVGTIDQGKPSAFWALDSWVTNDSGQRSVADDMAGLSSGREFTLMFNVPEHTGALRLNIGDSLVMDLAPFLDPVSAPDKQRRAVAPTAPAATGAVAETAEVDDLFLLEGKPVSVSLTRHDDGTWLFTPDQEHAGAVAEVQMTGGEILDGAWTAQTDAVSWKFRNLTKNSQFTGFRLPDGKMGLVLTSKRLYGERFRFVFDLGTSTLRFDGAASKLSLFFLDEVEKPAAPSAPAAAVASRSEKPTPAPDEANTCGGAWGPIAARVPGAKVALTVSTKEGQEWLEWPNPAGDFVKLQVYKAKAPVGAQGEIVTCATGEAIHSVGNSSQSLRDLLKDPQPGYYAVRVTVGTARADDPANTSDWITIQLKQTEAAAPVSTAPAPAPAGQGERTLTLNGSPIQVREDQAHAMKLAGSNDTFKDKSGRKVVIQDFEFDKKSAKYVVNAQMTLSEGQTTTVQFDRACRGLIGNDAKVKHSRIHETTDGSLDLAQVGDKFVFRTTSGSVHLGVSFDLDSALTGDLEGHTSFDYFTVGAKVHAGSDIRIANCRN